MVNQSSGDTVTATNRIFLTEKRHVNVQKWNSQVFVCVREFYKTEEGGEFKAGRKGINLPIVQWRELLKQGDAINKMIKELEDVEECGTEQNDNGKWSDQMMVKNNEMMKRVKSNYEDGHYNWMYNFDTNDVVCDC